MLAKVFGLRAPIVFRLERYSKRRVKSYRLHVKTNLVVCCFCSCWLNVTVLPGLLRRNKMLPAASGPSDSSVWRPGLESITAANEALARSEVSKRRFSVAGTRPTAAGVHLRRMVTPITDKAVDRLPGPAATVFSSIVHVLSGGGDGAATGEIATRWLELLLEAVYVEVEGLTLVPEAHASRLFRRMGWFVKVSDGCAI